MQQRLHLNYTNPVKLNFYTNNNLKWLLPNIDLEIMDDCIGSYLDMLEQQESKSHSFDIQMINHQIGCKL